MKESCANCVNYDHRDEAHRTGREWLHSTGFCTLPSLNSMRRKTSDTSWCSMWCEADQAWMPPTVLSEATATGDDVIPQTMTDMMVAPETIPDLAGAPTPPYENLYDLIATAQAVLKELQSALDELQMGIDEVVGQNDQQ